MRKIALDIGTKTCGFAVSDEMAIIASPLETIYFEENDLDKIKEYLRNYFAKNNVDSIIVGFPMRSNGEPSERTIMIDRFSQSLRKEFDKKIFLVNEYGTTIAAINILKNAKLSIKKRKENKDTLSAVLILKEFLEYGGKEI
ncbi:Holliday junction resolvase RuvX [Mycoplasma sp. Mirounga ES2805-ORL]|uniref:Holliday junction resolvase RuvX n=1 Tax=Mycoplasma sp. Mirounga ES2805-ORL TaxID=754514 RepID=UPI00197B78E8|nr:Holliday junction resolvase RuvX [Mycoplasma sp. Mirounga ES2805-ORL]QSF13986.1 Holliday junction resolvase RuvX [Mycoplasma sp. Mirounga ES2805-ORL]